MLSRSLTERRSLCVLTHECECMREREIECGRARGAANVRGFIMLILCAVAAFLIIKKTFINH